MTVRRQERLCACCHPFLGLAEDCTEITTRPHASAEDNLETLLIHLANTPPVHPLYTNTERSAEVTPPEGSGRILLFAVRSRSFVALRLEQLHRSRLGMTVSNLGQFVLSSLRQPSISR